MNFPHLLESYEEQVADLPNLEAKYGHGNPWTINARAAATETLASYYLANDDPRYRDQLQRGLHQRMESWTVEGDIGAWDFVLYSCVALAIEDFSSQKKLLGFDLTTDGFTLVTRELCSLHKAIFLEESYVLPTVKKTKGEEFWFRALFSFAEKVEPNWADFDSYWKSTRNRSHSLTILQHRNLLKDGMQVLWSHRHS